MKETKKEKTLRITLVFLSIILVFIGFLLQQKETEYTQFDLETTVVHVSETTEDPPVITLYRHLKGKHLLITYRINLLDAYHFEVLSKKEIFDAPNELQSDKETRGVWVRFDGKWEYFNSLLVKEDRDHHFRSKAKVTLPYKLTEEKDKTIVKLKNERHTFVLPDDEILQAIYPLTSDRRLLLLLLKDDIKVLVLK